MGKPFFYNTEAEKVKNLRTKRKELPLGIPEQSCFAEHDFHLLGNILHFLIQNRSSRYENDPAWCQLPPGQTESFIKQPSCTVPAYCPFIEFTGTDDSAVGTGFRI